MESATAVSLQKVTYVTIPLVEVFKEALDGFLLFCFYISDTCDSKNNRIFSVFCLFVLIFYFFFNLISCIQNILLIFIYIIVCNNVKIYFFQNKCFTGETNTMPSVGLIVTLFS